ncbi:hypothetical protein [Hyphococcus sp.]|uniref:hypothetical protein n=1 Tax=Hyphococcus sp. TaxID=2038636 RepID=UPI0035C690C6
MTDTDLPIKAKFSIDLQQMLDIMFVGARRTSAFLRLGLDNLDTSTPEDFVLGKGNLYSFWPENLADKDKAHAKEEYSAWLTGSCLKELDHYFALFLDDVWFKCELAELHNKLVPSHLVVGDRKFQADTNVASKLKKISERIGCDTHAEAFSSLSLARNCLTHGMGKVRNRDLNSEDSLRISWLAIHAYVDDGKKEISLNKSFEKNETLYFPNGGNLFVRIEEFSHAFKIGEKIAISLQQIAEICWFYIHQATKVHAAMLTYLQDKGIKRSNGEGESAV